MRQPARLHSPRSLPGFTRQEASLCSTRRRDARVYHHCPRARVRERVLWHTPAPYTACASAPRACGARGEGARGGGAWGGGGSGPREDGPERRVVPHAARLQRHARRDAACRGPGAECDRGAAGGRGLVTRGRADARGRRHTWSAPGPSAATLPTDTLWSAPGRRRRGHVVHASAWTPPHVHAATRRWLRGRQGGERRGEREGLVAARDGPARADTPRLQCGPPRVRGPRRRSRGGGSGGHPAPAGPDRRLSCASGLRLSGPAQGGPRTPLTPRTGRARDMEEARPQRRRRLWLLRGPGRDSRCRCGSRCADPRAAGHPFPVDTGAGSRPRGEYPRLAASGRVGEETRRVRPAPAHVRAG